MKNETKRKLIAVLFPERCPYCRRVVKPCEIACDDCKDKFPDHSYEKTVVGGYRVVSAVPYKDSFSDAIKRVKFGGRKQYAYQLSKLMSQCFMTELKDIDFDVITAVPLHQVTYKERGFNQSELLARFLSAFVGIKYETLIKKTRKNEPQHKLTADKREKNVKGVFRCIEKTAVKGKNILLIDDIVTTGYTLGECAKILKDSGADEIYCLTFAISLPKTT